MPTMTDDISRSAHLKYKYETSLTILIVCLIVYKLPFLNIPYYWDEAWPYSTAVHQLIESGLSFTPSSIPAYVSRGHPIMFHFLAAAWGSIFGPDTTSMHSFALTVSIITIVGTFFFGKAFWSPGFGFACATVLSTQAIFISQSAQLLPEMMMAMWTVLSFLFYFSRKYISFTIVTAAMLLTKESGCVLLATLALAELMKFLNGQINQTVMLRKWLLLAAPTTIAFFYFVAQKLTYGWFLFPFYTDYLSSNWTSFGSNFQSALEHLFIYYGRIVIVSISLISLISIQTKGKKPLKLVEKDIVFTFSLFFFLYLIFSAFNYYIPRYLLCVFPVFSITCCLIIHKASERVNMLFPLLIGAISSVSLGYYLAQKYGGDNNYIPSVVVAKQMVNYCESINLQKSKIYAPSVIRIDLQEPFAGFLSGKAFENIQSEMSDETEFVIISRDELDNNFYDKIRNERKLLLIKRYEINYAWCELYKVKR